MTRPAYSVVVRAVDRFVERTIERVAVLGGLVLLAVAFTTAYSVVGRAILRSDVLSSVTALSWWRPVRGDVEIVELGTAVAVLAFLPFCHRTGGNVVVEAFTRSLSVRWRAVLGAAGDALLATVAGLLAWRTGVAAAAYLAAPYPQTTMVLQLPLGVPYAVATALLWLLFASCLRSLLTPAAGRVVPTEEHAPS